METKQVNYTSRVGGDDYYWISDYREDGYKGELIDTLYMDGADYTDWCQFVGTEEECQRYIEEKRRTGMPLVEGYNETQEKEAGVGGHALHQILVAPSIVIWMGGVAGFGWAVWRDLVENGIL